MSTIPTTVQREAATKRCTELDALGFNLDNFPAIVTLNMPKIREAHSPDRENGL